MPVASLSAPVAAPRSIQQDSPVPAAQPTSAPVTIVDAAPIPTPKSTAATEPLIAPVRAPEPAEGAVVCGTLAQVFQSTHKKGMERPAIATICADVPTGAGESVKAASEGDAGH